jgi:hypothetical protein
MGCNWYQFILDRHERLTWLWRQLDADRVAGSYHASNQNDAHDARFANEPTLIVTPKHSRHQPGLKTVQLRTRIAQAGHLDRCHVA